MTPVDPSSSLLIPLIRAPFRIVYDLIRFALLCVKWLFDTVYAFFNPPPSSKITTVVVDPNLVAIGEGKRGEFAKQEKEAWIKPWIPL